MSFDDSSLKEPLYYYSRALSDTCRARRLHAVGIVTE